jgi:hypothetical protein
MSEDNTIELCRPRIEGDTGVIHIALCAVMMREPALYAEYCGVSMLTSQPEKTLTNPSVCFRLSSSNSVKSKKISTSEVFDTLESSQIPGISKGGVMEDLR